jgi:predicted HAD superfamily Cof-like phosphohydrolase
LTSPLEKIIQAESLLNSWLVSQTPAASEVAQDVHSARILLIDAMDEMDSTDDPVSDSDIARTKEFFEKAYPEPKAKNFHTQLGVHFEEIAEFTASLQGTDRLTQAMLTQVLVATHALALHLKASKEHEVLVDIRDHVEFLDGLCDQLVTSVGVAHMARKDIVGGFGEVNRSNFSKFDDNGLPILDNNLKMVKGPNYFKPNLKPYI